MGTSHRFATFELRPAERLLLSEGRPVALGARAFDLLVALVAQAGERVAKDTLLRSAWPGLVVGEANIHAQVSRLRRVLGAGAIATVPGLGYRFTLPLEGGGRPDVPNNLPAERTPFVGRAALLERAARRLGQGRLLTLTGIGGCGKTRLARTLAGRVRAQYPDGVWFVDLAPLDDADQVAEALAAAAGTRLAGGPLLGAVAQQLRERRTLVLLDNAEHLLDATAAIADALLAAAPGLRLLVTSREALGLDGEAVLPVPPLALPDAGADAQAIGQAEAVRLFVQRAAQADPVFRLDAANAATVAAVCRRVDGIPLAIELAAAQLRVVSPGQLHGLLEERFRLMLGGRRALPRQQSLRTVIAWSLQRLQAADRALLGALAACTAACDVDAARALAGEDAPADAVFAGLARLADQSLLTVQHDEGAPRRVVLLETVRQLAAEEAEASGAAGPARARHARHFVATAQALESAMHRGLTGAEVIRAMDRDRDNLLHAFDHVVAEGTPQGAAAALGLAAAMRHYWPSRATVSPGLRIGLAALAAARGLAPGPDHLKVLASTAQFASWLGRHDEALALARDGHAMAGALHDGEMQAGALGLMGAIERSRGALDAAAAHHEAALALARTGGFAKPQGHALSGLADIARARGRLDEAQQHLDAVLALRRDEGHPYHLGVALLNAASVAIDRRDAAPARERLYEAVRLLPRLDSTYLGQSTLDIAAGWFALDGDWDAAATLGAASRALRGALELPPDNELEVERRQRQDAARAALGDAVLAQALARGRAMTLADALALVAHRLGD